MTNREIIDLLISMGHDIEAHGMPAADVLLSLRPASHINRLGKDEWKAEASALTNSELVALMKGLTYAESELKWLGGSAAGPIWLFSILLSRDVTRDLIDRTAAWITRNTKNPYSPFGTIVSLGAQDYSEFQRRSRERGELIGQEVRRDEEITQWARIEREERKVRRQRAERDRRSAKRAEMLDRFNGMSIREQLIEIAKDRKYPPRFYPTKCADSVDDEILIKLPRDVLDALVIKLKGKQRGPWGKFKKRLLAVVGPVSIREPWKMDLDNSK